MFPIRHTSNRQASSSKTLFSACEWLATLTTVPYGLGSNLGEGMDVCKCIVPLLHWGTLNSHQAASPLVRLVEGEERWEAPGHPQDSSPSKLGRNREKSYYHLHGAQS
ncbi:uncharacterized protein TNCV_530691 [Trichonephila clavipes]|nr:uncharacterized protein TNCV_530691 [Trichonephila clavipes]